MKRDTLSHFPPHGSTIACRSFFGRGNGIHVPRLQAAKRFLLGRPLSNEEVMHQRLSNPVALAVFASDALSSVAYAGQEILIMLALAGTAALGLAWPISIGIAVLMVIVTFSYRQTIRQYPHGGGSYIVSKENLGTIPGLIAGASLLVDYTLTVAVSISAGTAAITSAYPGLYEYRVAIAVFFLFVLLFGNLRGTKESGAIFTFPTYAFIVAIAITVGIAVGKYFLIGPESIRVPSSQEVVTAAQGLSLFLIARAFSSGCAAMTGIEAIANGVQAFREPEWKNARRTLTAMGVILITLFLGLAWVAMQAGVHPSETETVISQISRQIYGTNIFYYIVSFATMGILVIAANTSFADFPRLAAFLANDDFLPRRFKEFGHRLVYSTGMIVLAVMALILIIGFRAQTTALIPLYAVGVFTSFTLSQSGMVRHHLRERERGWRAGMLINLAGAIVTGAVTLIIAVTKFTSGAWMVLIIIPIIIGLFLYIHHHYKKAHLAAALELRDARKEFADLESHRQNHIVVLAKDFDKRLLVVLRYANTMIEGDLRALHIAIDSNGSEFRKRWEEYGIEIPLDIIESPYRLVIEPLVDYIEALRKPGDLVTVVLGEFSPDDSTDLILHDQLSTYIKWALFKLEKTVVVSVPFVFKD